MDLHQVEAFLVLSEELHFGRTAERLYLSQPRVSRLIAALEHEIGGALFERSSRRVELTPLGVQLRDQLQPAYTQLQKAFDQASTSARETTSRLRIGFTATTGGEALAGLTQDFESRHPDCEISLHEVDVFDPYGPLRTNAIDVLVNWLIVDEPDLTTGPTIEQRDRVLAVATTHLLAKKTSVSIEDIANYQVTRLTPPFPSALYDVLIPTHTPSGKVIPRPAEITGTTTSAVVLQIARGRIVHPTVTSVALFHRDDIVLVPIHDLPPLPLGLIWRTAHENARIRALADTALQVATGRTLHHPSCCPQ